MQPFQEPPCALSHLVFLVTLIFSFYFTQRKWRSERLSKVTGQRKNLNQREAQSVYWMDDCHSFTAWRLRAHVLESSRVVFNSQVFHVPARQRTMASHYLLWASLFSSVKWGDNAPHPMLMLQVKKWDNNKCLMLCQNMVKHTVNVPFPPSCCSNYYFSRRYRSMSHPKLCTYSTVSLFNILYICSFFLVNTMFLRFPLDFNKPHLPGLHIYRVFFLFVCFRN